MYLTMAGSQLQSPKLQRIEFKPQEGFQEKFLSSPADVVIGGGSAGGGKTYALLLDTVRYLDVENFGAVIFRRTTPQIRNEGALWDTSTDIYPYLGGVPKESTLEWVFADGKKASVKFSHLEHEKNIYDHQGAQYPFIGFDELTHFTQKQFFYMLTRNRSTCGVPPCVRATCNPDPDSWVAKFIEWWIDQDTGFPIPERDGVLRYFTIQEGIVVWGDSKKEVLEKCPGLVAIAEKQKVNPNNLVLSATFIRGSIYDNKILLEINPQYLGNLIAQDDQTRAQLLDGNWKIRQDNSALCDYGRVHDLFTNFVLEYQRDENGEFKLDENGNRILKVVPKRITCDVARFGRDFTVIIGWLGYYAKYIWVYTKSKTTDVVKEIEKMRELLQCGKSDVVVDQDGVGGGVVDQGGYVGFSANSAAVEDPNTKIKENYKNLKTQLYYRFAEQKINEGFVGFNPEGIQVDGEQTSLVLIGKEYQDVQKLVKEDLRCFKRVDVDIEGKKRMNDKESQKIILNGRSPDFGDAIMLREWFDVTPKSSFSFIALG